MEKKKNSVLSTISAHGQKPREENDYYATPDNATYSFLDCLDPEILEVLKQNGVWEPSCGEGALSNILRKKGIEVKRESDLIQRSYSCEIGDFLEQKDKTPLNIITNPPFKLVEDFIQKGYELLEDGNYMIYFARVQLIEGIKRFNLFQKMPIKQVYVHSQRVKCEKGGIPTEGSSAQCFIWVVIQKGYQGETTLKWIPPHGTKYDNL